MLMNVSLLCDGQLCHTILLYQQAPPHIYFEAWPMLWKEPCCPDNEKPLAFQSQVSMVRLSVEQHGYLIELRLLCSSSSCPGPCTLGYAYRGQCCSVSAFAIEEWAKRLLLLILRQFLLLHPSTKTVRACLSWTPICGFSLPIREGGCNSEKDVGKPATGRGFTNIWRAW